jgi:hypothetical protein
MLAEPESTAVPGAAGEEMRSMWEGLRWWAGTPSMEMVARRAMRAVESQGATNVSFDAKRGVVQCVVAGNASMISLANLYADVLRAPRRRRDDVIRRFVQAVVLPVSLEPPASFEQARARLVPIVRTLADDAFAVLNTERLATPGAPADNARMAARPIAGDLIAGIAYDSPQAMQRITADQLARWGVSLERAFDEATQNLRAMPERGGWRALGAGLWSGEWGDSYESSRVLLPDLIHRLGVADPVVLMPLRHMLLVASARNEPALVAMAGAARGLIEENTRWLSLQPLALTSDGWQLFVPPDAVRPAFEDLLCIEQASTYGEQNTLLEEINRRQALDIYVAKVSVMQRREGGRLLSWCVWSQGVDTLLPRTLVVVFNRVAPGGTGAEREHLTVRWDAVQAIAGALMMPTGHAPPRWRVSAFPDAAQWAKLKAVGEPFGAAAS